MYTFCLPLFHMLSAVCPTFQCQATSGNVIIMFLSCHIQGLLFNI